MGLSNSNLWAVYYVIGFPVRVPVRGLGLVMFGTLAEFTVSGVHGFRALAAGFRGVGEF